MAKERNIAIDRFRGIAIILMVIVNDLLDVPGFPKILTHPEDVGFTIADLVEYGARRLTLGVGQI